MKHLLIIPICLALSFCSDKNQVAEEVSTKEIYAQERVVPEIIEIEEFFPFFGLFQNAIVENDTSTLLTMLSDEIYHDNRLGGWMPPISSAPLANLSNDQQSKTPKQQFLTFFNHSFTHRYLYLFKEYDVEKALETKKIRRRLLKERPINVDSLRALYSNYLLVEGKEYFSVIYEENRFWIYRTTYSRYPGYAEFLYINLMMFPT